MTKRVLFYGRQNLSADSWRAAFDGLEYLDKVGKAFDVNGIVSAADDQSVTEDQINWVLGNYLLVKGARSYTYIYAGNGRGFTGSASGYGTFTIVRSTTCGSASRPRGRSAARE